MDTQRGMGGAAPLPPDSEQLISSTGLLGSKTVELKKRLPGTFKIRGRWKDRQGCLFVFELSYCTRSRAAYLGGPEEMWVSWLTTPTAWLVAKHMPCAFQMHPPFEGGSILYAQVPHHNPFLLDSPAVSCQKQSFCFTCASFIRFSFPSE